MHPIYPGWEPKPDDEGVEHTHAEEGITHTHVVDDEDHTHYEWTIPHYHPESKITHTHASAELHHSHPEWEQNHTHGSGPDAVTHKHAFTSADHSHSTHPKKDDDKHHKDGYGNGHTPFDPYGTKHGDKSGNTANNYSYIPPLEHSHNTDDLLRRIEELERLVLGSQDEPAPAATPQLTESYFMVNSVMALAVAPASVEVDSFCIEAGDTLEFSASVTIQTPVTAFSLTLMQD